MREDQWIVVDIDDPRLGCGCPRHVVRVVGGREPGADVEELPHAEFDHEMADRPREEVATRTGLVALPGVAEEVEVAQGAEAVVGALRHGRSSSVHPSVSTLVLCARCISATPTAIATSSTSVIGPVPRSSPPRCAGTAAQSANDAPSGRVRT